MNEINVIRFDGKRFSAIDDKIRIIGLFGFECPFCFLFLTVLTVFEYGAVGSVVFERR